MAPIYEYSCGECLLKRDFMMSIHDSAPVCPICGHTMTKEIPANTTHRFSGGENYKNHYHNPNSKLNKHR